LSLEDKNGKHQEVRIIKNMLFSRKNMVGFHKYLNLENLKTRANALLPNGVLTLVLEIIKPEPATESAADFYDKDLETVWLDTDRDFSDIQISSNGKIFSCHRVLLAARSPVLRAMCETNFKEGNTREINMDSVDTQIVEVS
jgi:speckle-type POZ protein